MKQIACPKCKQEDLVKSGVVKGASAIVAAIKTIFTVPLKSGKTSIRIMSSKALQLYIEGVTYREIERILWHQSCIRNELGEVIQHQSPRELWSTGQPIRYSVTRSCSIFSATVITWADPAV